MESLKPAEVFPPGEFLKDELESRGWSQTDLAEIMGRHVSVINELISAKRGLTADMAQSLADALGGSPQFWLNLESTYRLSLLPKNDIVARRAKLYAKAPLREMIRRGWIEDPGNIEGLEGAVISFLGISSLDDDAHIRHAARKSTSYHEPPSETQTAWLCRARQLAEAVHAEKFSRERLPLLIDELRGLAGEPTAVVQVPGILSRFGIRFLMIEALAGTKIDGATIWIADVPVVVLSLRFDRIDHFWHTLLHEIAHVWFDDGPMLDQDIVGVKPVPDPYDVEERANDFAASVLVPKERIADFVLRVRPLFSATRVQNFARTMGVHAGIVVGQLQHMHEIGYENLRKMLVPVRGHVMSAALTDGWGIQPSLPKH